MEHVRTRPTYSNIVFVPVEIKSGRRPKHQRKRKERYEQDQSFLQIKKITKKQKNKRTQRPMIKRTRHLRKKKNRSDSERMNSLFNELHLLDS